MNPNYQYTINSLIRKLKLNALIPRNQSTYTDEDFAYLFNNELQQTIVPWIMAEGADFFVNFVDTPTFSNQNRYPLPVRAIGTKLKTVSWVFPNASPNQQPSLSHIPQMSPEKASSWSWSVSASPGYWIEGNTLVMYPMPQVGPPQVFRMWYYKRPNSLVPQANGAFITAIWPETNQVTLSNIPSGDFVWTVGSTVDIVDPNPPFNTIAEDVEITGINGYQYTLESLEGIVVGQTIALSNQAIVAQIPVELQELLVEAVAVKALSGFGDATKLKMAGDNLTILKSNLFNAIAPRVDSDPPRIVGADGIKLYNRPGLPWRNS
jgi:hypothetical protein